MLSTIIKELFFLFNFFLISDSGRSESDRHIDIDSNSDSDNRDIDSVLTCFNL